MARILIIDDDDSLRSMLGDVLEAEGHEVVLAANGREGLEICRAAPFDLVLTDLYMPDQEGLETIAKLHRDFPEIAVVAMSGKRFAHSMLSVARQLGAVATLEKAFSADEMLVTIGKALRSVCP
jgi:DNA-binding NtrC family response regulator